MNLSKALLLENSKAQADKITRYIGDDQERFKELMDLFFNFENTIAQRAARVMSRCVRNYPELINPYLNKVLDNLKKPVHDAIKRNTVRALQEVDIPEKFMGKATDRCFELFSKPSESIAIRVFTMTVLMNITKKQPELKNELKILIEDQLPYASAAFLSRAKRVLKELNKLP